MPVKLTIITINLNNAAGLKKTIESVANQSYRNLDYVVIDGGSQDDSQQVIRNYETFINSWVSEPDKGIYHAMNKGIQKATGDYCLFLNSGDWLATPTILENVFAQNPEADIVAGDVYFYNTQENAIKWHVPSPDRLTAKTLFLGTLPHQATFIRRTLFDKVGLYNETLKIASDWLFFLEALLKYGCTYQHYQGTIAYFNMDGISCNSATESLPRREQLAVLANEYPLFLPDYERLDQLETQTLRWRQSNEYRVYHFLDRIGFIRLGVFLRRIKRVIQRTLY
ncbi:glycosyltransferase family 2 protein [Spirosoma endbachense]|uniref:Glycosyltransferase n=1 Tax=Spirosoma endbachense TaxID=2666025 RepID=A0A6P1VRF0_9BACT|nr:glycosyltransferase family 2 protein [Spirosoma endbachense]QHV95275.1 glycosyltransferase [Spirosoma endbachense]